MIHFAAWRHENHVYSTINIKGTVTKAKAHGQLDRTSHSNRKFTSQPRHLVELASSKPIITYNPVKSTSATAPPNTKIFSMINLNYTSTYI